MPEGFLKHLDFVLKNADILLEVIDARFPNETRNFNLEKKIKEKGKKLLIALNKADLVEKKCLFKTKNEIQKEMPCIAVSARKKFGLNKLRKIIGILSRKKKTTIGIFGYPNTGKSSLINALIGKHAAGTGLSSGFTRGAQIINLSNKIKIIDSPGIIPFSEKNEFVLALTSAKSVEKIKEPVDVALKLIEFLQKHGNVLQRQFSINNEVEPEKALELIAFQKKKLLKGGIPDLTNTAKILIRKWQRNELK